VKAWDRKAYDMKAVPARPSDMTVEGLRPRDVKADVMKV
jgi:hypothetical protein